MINKNDLIKFRAKGCKFYKNLYILNIKWVIYHKYIFNVIEIKIEIINNSHKLANYYGKDIKKTVCLIFIIKNAKLE